MKLLPPLSALAEPSNFFLIDLQQAEMATRSSRIKPALPDLSRLFVSQAKQKSPNTVQEDAAFESESTLAAAEDAQTGQTVKLNGTHETLAGGESGQQDSLQATLGEDKEVSALTGEQPSTQSRSRLPDNLTPDVASPAESPPVSASTPATQDFAPDESQSSLQILDTEEADKIDGIQVYSSGPDASVTPPTDTAGNTTSRFDGEQSTPHDASQRSNLDPPTPTLMERALSQSSHSSTPSVPSLADKDATASPAPPSQAIANLALSKQVSPVETLAETHEGHENSVGMVVNGHGRSYTDDPAPPRTPSVPESLGHWQTINDYFLNLAVTKELADWAIQIYAPGTGNDAFAVYGHSVILGRSHRLRRLMARSQSYGNSVISLYPPQRIQPHAFDSALRFLYSDSLLTKDYFNQQPSSHEREAVRQYHLDYILSYWISGVELGLDLVTAHSEALLSDYLDWDLLESVYKSAIAMARSDISSHGKYMTGSDYFNLSSTLLRLVVQFLASRLNVVNFKLDSGYSSSTIASRLPSTEDGRPRTNPVLASMVFGSMPSSSIASDSSPTMESVSAASAFQDAVASAILLNLDFEDLSRFNHLLQARGMAANTRIMTEVVREREARRQKIFNAVTIPNRDRMAASAKWDIVGREESFVDGVLSEKRVGFLLPPPK